MTPGAYRFPTVEKILRSLLILFLLLGTGSPAAADPVTPTFLPLISKSWVNDPGNITGRVTDAIDPDPATNGVANVQVCYLQNCTLTNGTGGYTLNGIPPGYRFINATANTYEPQSARVFVLGAQTVTLNIVISRQLIYNDVEFRVIVTWRTEQTWPPESWPNDLDSQLWMIIPPQQGIPAHIDPSNDRGSCSQYPYACVETDAQYGSGPETVDIRRLQPKTAYYFGLLNFYASYNGVPPITESQAKIQVYDTTGLIATLDVPTSGSGDLWYAFMFDSSGTITTTNCITSMPGELYEPPECD
jgi:hypothetical protein